MRLDEAGRWYGRGVTQSAPGPSHEPTCRELTAARAVRVLSRPRPLVTRVTRAHAFALRASRGRIKRSALLGAGQPVLSLTTTGRRSGQLRSTVVAYMKVGDDYVVTAANLGSEVDPSWYLNLIANPHAKIEVDGRRVIVNARRASGEEAQHLWVRWAQRLPAADTFRHIAGREIPVIVLAPES